MRKTVLLAIWFCCTVLTCSVATAGPEIPGPPQTKPIAIVDATVHRVSRPAQKTTSILFEEGRITAIGRDLRLPAGTHVIQAEGKHVYPGLFNTDSVIGLIEVNAVRATDDRAEVGLLNMNVRAEVAVNPDSELIPVTRSGGVLLTLTVPQGGLISGTSAVLQLDGWTTEDITLHAPAAMHMRWPALNEAEHQETEGKTQDKDQQRDEQMRRIEEVFDRAAAYRKAREANSTQPVDLRWEAMIPVLKGTLPLVVTAHRAAQIQSAIAFADRRKLRLVIFGGNDAEQCTALLKTANVPVIIDGIYRLPLRRDAPYDHRYTLPSRLKTAGVQYCIAGTSRFDGANVRNLPYHAAMAIAFGLSRREALRAITLSPARIFGLDDVVGSLDEGKHATLIVTDGDVFDTATHITHAFIQGRTVDLSDRQKRLNRKYQLRQAQDNTE